MLHFIFFNHSPKIMKSRVHGSLRSNQSFSLNCDVICVNVILNSIGGLIVSKFDSCWLKSHDVRISIETELFRVFIEFIDVILGFCHEFDHFKLAA